MSSYVDIDVDADPQAIEQAIFDSLELSFPGWMPAPGDLITQVVRALAFQMSDLAELAADARAEIFRRFGEVIVGIPALAATSAQTTSTWTVTDDAGYIIPAGALVGIPSGEDLIGFRVETEVLIPGGSTATAAGAVTLTAVEPGAAANDLNSDPVLIEALPFVTEIVLEDPTHGGIDAETGDAYLDRLRGELQLLSPKIILPRDAEIAALRVPGIARAVALDGYNPIGPSTGNERMLAVAIVGANGESLGSGVKTQLTEILTARREINFVFHAIDPTYTEVDVDVEFVPYDGFDPAIVTGSVEAAIAAYLSPASWGRSPFDDDTTWRNMTVVRHSELITVVNNVTGVDYVNSLTLAEGGGSLGTSNVTLDEPAPLATPGDINVTAA